MCGGDNIICGADFGFSFGNLITAEMKPNSFVVLCTLYLSLTLSFMMCCHDNITITRRGYVGVNKSLSTVHISAVIHWQSPKLKPFLFPCTLYLVFGTLSLDLRHFSNFQLAVVTASTV